MIDILHLCHSTSPRPENHVKSWYGCKEYTKDIEFSQKLSLKRKIVFSGTGMWWIRVTDRISVGKVVCNDLSRLKTSTGAVGIPDANLLVLRTGRGASTSLEIATNITAPPWYTDPESSSLVCITGCVLRLYLNNVAQPGDSSLQSDSRQVDVRCTLRDRVLEGADQFICRPQNGRNLRVSRPRQCERTEQ